MSEQHEERLIAEAVARYFGGAGGAGGSAGAVARPSVDQLVEEMMPGVDSDARAAARVSLIGALSRAARSGVGRSGVGDDYAPDREEAVPEIPGYDLIEEIGRGGMGVVYEGYQRSTGRRVAVKFMRGMGRGLALRFEREVDLLARLSHPGVVSVIDSGGQGGRWYYVMEHVDGRPLDEFLKPGEGDIRVTLALLADVADIVNEAHQRGVLHRDLKPANILVERGGRVRLLDFGLAKAIDPDSGMHAELTISDAGRPMGTLAYMPPEQAAGGSKGISVRSDVYALGVIGYYLLTGRHPIDVDGSLVEVVQRIQSESVARPSSIRARLGADVDAIIAKAMAKLAQDRYATAAELASDIRRWLEGRTITARQLPRGVRAWRWVRRNKVLAGVVGGCVALLVTMGWVSVARIIGERDRANALLLETFARFTDSFQMEESARQRMDAAATLYGKDSRLYAITVIQYAMILERFQRNTEAEAMAREGVERVRALRAASDLDVAIACLHHGRILAWMGRAPEAEPLLREAYTKATEAGDFGGRTGAHAALFLGNLLNGAGRYAESEAPLRSAYAWWSADPPARDDGWYSVSVKTLAECLLRQGRLTDAEGVLLESLAGTEREDPPNPDRRLRFIQTLSDYYSATGRADEAARYLAMYREGTADGRKPFTQEIGFPSIGPE